MRTLIFLLLLSINCTSMDLNLGLGTKHINGRNPNEDNQLIGLTYNSYRAGTFINSYTVRSIYAAKDFKITTVFSASAGIVTGYDPKCMFGEIVDCRKDLIIPLVAFSWKPYKNLEIITMANAFTLILNIPLELK